MKRCALLTCPELEGNIFDEDRLEKALSDKGWTFSWFHWQDDQVDWSQWDCAIIRTTWDYTVDLPHFLRQLQKIQESSCRLFNDYQLVRWNSDKGYLKELSTKGVPTIDTLWLESPSAEEIKFGMNDLKTQKAVIKPQFGAGAKNTYVLNSENLDSLESVVAALKGQKVMLQPFMNKVQEEGEYSAHFFGGQHSHTVLKTPKGNDFRSQEEFGSFVRAVDLTPAQMTFAKNVLSNIQGECLYARVDFINDDQGSPCLIELELIEPSLYFRYYEEGAVKMVEALESMRGCR